MRLYTDSLHKIAYATDASVYREIPYGVAYPKTEEDIRELIETVRKKGLDLIPRAGGTSIAGQVVGSGIVAARFYERSYPDMVRWRMVKSQRNDARRG